MAASDTFVCLKRGSCSSRGGSGTAMNTFTAGSQLNVGLAEPRGLKRGSVGSWRCRKEDLHARRGKRRDEVTGFVPVSPPFRKLAANVAARAFPCVRKPGRQCVLP